LFIQLITWIWLLFQLKRSADTAQREKDEAVVKYATRESEILKLNAERQKVVDQLKHVTVERDALAARLRGSKNEKDTVRSTVDQMVRSPFLPIRLFAFFLKVRP
jgi:uncharacterized coiled-coil DUF342 family protein